MTIPPLHQVSYEFNNDNKGGLRNKAVKSQVVSITNPLTHQYMDQVQCNE